MGSLIWKAYKVSQWLALCFASFFFFASAHAGGWVEETGQSAESPYTWVTGGLTGSAACLAVKAAGYPASQWQFQSVPTQYTNETKCYWKDGNNFTKTTATSQRWACGATKTAIQAGNGDPYDKLPTTACAAACPSGYVEQPQGSTTICVPQPSCPSGQHWDTATSQCVPDNPCASGEGTQQRLTFIRCQDSNGNGVCDPQESPVFPPPDMSVSGCGFTFDSQVALSGGIDCFKVPPSQTMYCELTMVQTGEQLAPTSSNTPTESSQLGTCGENQSPMTIGGKTFCFDNNATSTSTTTTQSKDAQGNVTGSATESKTTTVDTQNGTVTETTNHADGSQSSVTQDASTYCKNFPNAEVCKAASGQATSSNSCSSPPTCSGDAVLCANLRQQWETTCAIKSALTPGEGEGFTDPGNDGDLGAEDGLIVGDNAFGASLDWHKIFFSETATSCGLVDQNIQVMGQSLTLPFSTICPYLDYLKAIVIVIASIVSIRMFAMAPW